MSRAKALCIQWTESAWTDLDTMTDYLFAEGMSFEDVEILVKCIFTAPVALATLPGAGKPGRMPSTREWRVRNSPYSLVYLVRDESIFILRVMHDSRQFPEQ